MKVGETRAMTEEEALQMLSGVLYLGGKYSAIKTKVLDLFNSGQKYGLVQAVDDKGHPIPEEECQKAATSLLNTFKNRNLGVGIRYVPAQKGFVFAPLAKMFPKE